MRFEKKIVHEKSEQLISFSLAGAPVVLISKIANEKNNALNFFLFYLLDF